MEDGNIKIIIGLLIIILAFVVGEKVGDYMLKSFEHSSIKCSFINEKASEVKGTPYRWGGNDPRGFDCSGFIWWFHKKAGVDLERTTALGYYQMIEGDSFHWGEAGCGDLIWFTIDEGRPFGHVGIMVEDNQFWHASYSEGIIKSKISEGNYYDKHFKGCKRLE